MTVEVATKAPAVPTPFELFGGAVAVRELVDRFYDLMEGDPDYAALRALHAAGTGSWGGGGGSVEGEVSSGLY